VDRFDQFEIDVVGVLGERESAIQKPVTHPHQSVCVVIAEHFSLASTTHGMAFTNANKGKQIGPLHESPALSHVILVSVDQMITWVFIHG